MQLRELGRTGLEVSPIALGCAAFAYRHEARDWDPLSAPGRKIVHNTIHTALDRGINYIDTAAAYGDGHSETLVGEVMKDRRDECILASKIWYELDEAGARQSVHDSLRRLQTDHIDIMQIHGRMYTPAEVDHILHGGPLAALMALRDEGKIGHIGITTEEPWTVLPFLEMEDFTVFQIAYNIICQGAARHFLPAAALAEAGVVTMRTMTSGVFQRQAGFLAPEWQESRDLYEVSLKFALADSRIHSGIVGMRWPEEVEQNLRLIEEWSPPVDFAAMPRLTKDVYQAEDREKTSG
jgi:aryl-alcohol dehydrogenase-like predicted oxidoreductase